MLKDPEFWLIATPFWVVGAWLGWQIADWQEKGFDQIFRIDVRYRFISLFRNIARL
jgi:hypothetical protein